MLARRRWSLVWKYAAWFSGLVSVLLVASGALAGYFAYRQAMAAVEESQAQRAQFVAEAIAGAVGRVEDTLALAVEKFGDDGPTDVDSLGVELIALLRHQPAIVELFWIAGDGRERLALSRYGRDRHESGRSWVGEARFEGLATRISRAGPVSFRSEGEPSLSLAVRRKLGGPVLLAELDLKFVSDALSRLRLERTDVAYVVDGAGRLISHADVGRVLAKTDVSALPQVRRAILGGGAADASGAESRGVDGAAVIATAVPIERLGWTVIAEQPRAEALRPVYATIARSSALVVVGVLAAIVASVVFARRMVRPIRQIETGARELGAGRLDRRIDVGTGDELEELGSQFNRMAERLQQIYGAQEKVIAERTRDLALANESKSRFLAAASHDLRQPMHALSLFVGQLQARSGSGDAPELVRKIGQSVETLEQLLETLLDLSKLDMGAVVAQPRVFGLHDLLARLVTQLSPVAEAKGLALTLVPTSLWVRSDALLLERVLLNLIGNAIRYTREGRVLVGCRRSGGAVIVVVADTGVGIAPEHLPNIFQEFYRAGPPAAASQGLGLGLAIVKRLAAILDVELTVDSVQGKGTAVRVRVPRADAGSREPVAPREPEQALRGTRVLVVDDDEAARDALQGLLVQWGCDAVVAAGGDEALARTQGSPPDAVLCDLALAGGASGLDAIERLRRLHGAGLPAAIITGDSTPEAVARVRALGLAIAFKPAKPAKVRALLEHLLAR
jgi:signal transduction histidine kinase/CheY-like chemotaxis protein